MSPNKLPLHEWCIVLLFCAILFLISLFAFRQHRQLPPLNSKLSIDSLTETVLLVRIEGNVTKPGFYRLPQHSLLKDLLNQAIPLTSADLSQIKENRELQDGQTIYIPERKWITIQMIGAVENPGPVKILSGTRYYELIDQIQVVAEANLKPILKKKGFLKEGDVVEIPFKKSKSSKV